MKVNFPDFWRDKFHISSKQKLKILYVQLNQHIIKETEGHRYTTSFIILKARSEKILFSLYWLITNYLFVHLCSIHEEEVTAEHGVFSATGSCKVRSGSTNLVRIFKGEKIHWSWADASRADVFNGYHSICVNMQFKIHSVSFCSFWCKSKVMVIINKHQHKTVIRVNC